MYLAFFSTELIMLLLYCKQPDNQRHNYQQHNHKQHKIRYLYALALLNGLSIAVHMWGTIALACYVVFVDCRGGGQTCQSGAIGDYGVTLAGGGVSLWFPDSKRCDAKW